MDLSSRASGTVVAGLPAPVLDCQACAVTPHISQLNLGAGEERRQDMGLCQETALPRPDFNAKSTRGAMQQTAGRVFAHAQGNRSWHCKAHVVVC